MPVVLLHGYFGFGNAGDEAILAGSLGLIRTRAAGWRPIVASGNPTRTEAVHDVEAAPRSRLLSMLRSLKEDDRFLLAGGGLLQDATSFRSLLAYLEPLRRAGRDRAAMWAVGVGPLSPAGRATVRAMGAPLRSVVRDEVSLAALRDLGYPEDSLALGADAAFTLPPAPRRGAKGEIGLAVRPDRRVDGLALGLDVVAGAARLGLTVRLLPFRMEEDGPLCEEIARRAGGQAHVAELPSKPGEIPQALSDLSGIVAERLHALILGSMAGIPAICVAYDPKVALHAAMLGAPVVAPSEISGAVAGSSWGDGDLARRRAGALGERATETFDALWRAIA